MQRPRLLIEGEGAEREVLMSPSAHSGKGCRKRIKLYGSLLSLLWIVSVVSVLTGTDRAMAAAAPRPEVLRLNRGPCVLLEAYWDNTPWVVQGTLVFPKVRTTGNCIGQQVRFIVNERDGVPDVSQADPVNLLVTGASTSWLAHSPGLYYFDATIIGDGQSIRSPNLEVLPGASPTTYYIDPNGDNGGAGTAPETAWRDFTPLSARTLRPGEQVLLKRGGSWNQLLELRGKGTPNHFILVGAYGSGPRARLCRSGDIADRVARILNPAYLRVASLEICGGGAGIVVTYDRDYNNHSVHFSDILAHDFTGIYEASGWASSNPAWQDYSSPDVGYSYAIGFAADTDARPHILLRDFRVTDSEVYKTGSGLSFSLWNVSLFTGMFTDAKIDNVYLHDNDWDDVSYASLVITGCQTCRFANILIDRGTGGAPRGTSAIFYGGSYNNTLDHVIVLNTPESWAPDNTAIDFESWTHAVVIQNSWFENNAGGAVEFFNNGGDNYDALIQSSVFVDNGMKRDFPNQGQIMVVDWPGVNESTGIIRNNWYVNPTGVVFFGGDAASRGGFALANNQQGVPASFPSDNIPPTVKLIQPADGTLYTEEPATIMLEAEASDADGSIARVEFYQATTNRTTKLATVTAPPYRYTWSDVYAFNEWDVYWLVAKAIDDDGAIGVSTSVLVTFGTPLPRPTFTDVPLSHPVHDSIELLYRAGYTAGCSTDPLMYCPEATMNRAESAVFVEHGVHDTAILPPQPTVQTFADLPLDSWAAKWAEALWQDNYTAGCGTDPLVYCPWQGHTRAEGCVFYLHMLNGPTYQPPQPSQQTFADVPLDAWYAKWVQAAYDAGLITTCQTTPDLRFCPGDPLSRALAASMMVRAKGLALP